MIDLICDQPADVCNFAFAAQLNLFFNPGIPKIDNGNFQTEHRTGLFENKNTSIMFK